MTSSLTRSIPRSAITSVADTLHQLIEQVMRENYPIAWGKLLSFGVCALKQPSVTMILNTEALH